MKCSIWSIGKDHEPYVKDGIAEFTKRSNKYFPVAWKIIAPPRNAGLLTEQDLKRKEADSVLASLSSHDYLVLLDEKGKTFASTGFSAFLQQRANESSRHVILLIGGAYGVDESIRQRANFVWSLSPLTFPHQLVRLILAEQLYRAFTILKNEKYHHI